MITNPIKYRYDKLQFSSLLPNYINSDAQTGSVSISGTMADGATQNFSCSITLTDGTTFFDVYVANPTLFVSENKVQLVSNSSISTCYNFISSEFIQNAITLTGNILTVQITVNNFTGGSITLSPQTVNVSVVEYELPL